jgi:hypothetical protein
MVFPGRVPEIKPFIRRDALYASLLGQEISPYYHMPHLRADAVFRPMGYGIRHIVLLWRSYLKFVQFTMLL